MPIPAETADARTFANDYFGDKLKLCRVKEKVSDYRLKIKKQDTVTRAFFTLK